MEPHWQTSNVTIRKQFGLITLNSKRFSGNLQNWFKSITRIHLGPHTPLTGCWYLVEGQAT